MARRFEGPGQDTWFGHQPRPSDALEPPAPDPPRTRVPAVTQGSHGGDGEAAWFRVRGPSRGPVRRVKTNEQRRPWPPLRLFGVAFPHWVVAVGIAGAALAGAGLALFLPGPPALEVIGFEVTPEGRDVLTVSCESCPDGSTLRLGTARATIAGGVARLASNGLAVGENRLPLELEVPGGATARVEVEVALAFRVSTDLRGITAVPPYALVVVSAPRGTSVSIGGELIPSDPGIVRARVELGPDARGPETRSLQVHRQVPIRVLGPNLERSTHATISATVVPLVLDAVPSPGEASGILRGRTSPGARVELRQLGEELSSTVADALGRFSLEVPPGPRGATTVAASAPGHVSRELDWIVTTAR